ncbi:hypothetical protein KFL_010710020 [Klebsormidium nitens]|uniref:S-adenosyl-L-methionine-dependent methyltransferase n=1 Tax=Klebsormidium nitens TaxID=105231 RepID=A0A1Y1IPL9_KLENI|nr:hypothetical protein KFL_010710020 [Klebsormidium nitens]|eukprot:GAQ92613.1 hypothetical protein KFL_010710020 [Klebsormidium nitens]
MPTVYGVNLRAATALQSIIGASSQAVAACRAVESEREDALFVDPLAKYFAAYAGGALPTFLSSYVSVRTHFIDRELLDALRRKHDQGPPGGVVPNQVVLLGAGMDGRMWRLPQQAGSPPPAEVVFELDQKEVVDAKDAVLAQLEQAGELPAPRLAKRRVCLSVDIRDPAWIQALNDAGHNRTSGTVWILEGFLRFFSNEQIDALIEQLSQNCACGSSILVTVPSATSRDRRRAEDPVDAKYQWRFGTDDPVSYFTRFGWKTVKSVSVEDLADQYNRRPRSTELDTPAENGSKAEPSVMSNPMRHNYLLRAVKID